MLAKSLLFLSTVLVAFSAWSIPEIQITSRFMSELLPYMQKNYGRAQFAGVGGLRINYYFRQVPQAKGVLIISPGQTESSLKYAEVLYDLKDLGYSIYIIDHRGQGLSDRTLPGTTLSHVNRFKDYVDDFTTFVKDVVHPENYRHSVIIAHSMGGAIASGFLLNNPTAVRAAIISSPMLEINTGKYGPLGAAVLSNILSLIGKGTQLAPSQTPYMLNPPFANNKVTSSAARFQAKVDLYKATPQIRIGGATVNWVKQALAYTTALRQKDNVYSVPTLIFQGGRDELVTAHGENQTCALSRNFCSIVKFPGAQHEILMEQDSIRNSALATIKAFLQKTEAL
jgi:lysophospholipase